MDAPEIARLDDLPADGLAELLAESEAAGLRFLRRLVVQWQNDRNRFDGPGEALFVARRARRVIGVCGLNADPYADRAGVGRLRHLYVLAAERRRGVGRRLVQAAVAAARGHFRLLRLRTPDDGAAQFYEALGFAACPGVPDCTHVLDVAGSTEVPAMTVPIRPATADDFPRIFPLLQQLWPNLALDPVTTGQALATALTTPNHFHFCAEESGRVVGFATLSVRHSLWQQAGIGYVGELVVDAAHRCRGIGTALLAFLADFAVARGSRRLELDSGFHRTDAHRMYERCGMQRRAFVFSRVLGAAGG
jgi:GNAT superfamily N-acetyltransferase